ncbi:hypothetical protein CC1G_12760 [Coprinopsis cinerea okayama7|uniref:N-acetyltransferase domain-containing protein n=1 Tax=Coprinopsis cinerea (strain Okayama-7 / 130 / ATCC MYA-4618 / FGSC 9003) TaxID=240176 RepID=A8PBW7_COPC7|nr:hypothetical protein CC1G_12760 [Coprinopsis cinerea okayama7\|eukprot:XP_001840283.1 hypothetical protein CC1G_12760 [Coprinopsis cinerea okayama7\
MTSADEPYDVNFCFPVPRKLENERLKLVPFVPSIHLQPFFTLCTQHPSIFTYLPYGPFHTLSSCSEWLEHEIQQDPGRVLFAIYDKTRRQGGDGSPGHAEEALASNDDNGLSTTEESSGNKDGAIAGAIAYINTSLPNLSTEIGCVKIFPPFQRTHVASNAVGLLLKYALELPSTSGLPSQSNIVDAASRDEFQGGLGLRRVFWQANINNTASIRLSARMGFTHEAVLRWDRVLPPWKDTASSQQTFDARNAYGNAESNQGSTSREEIAGANLYADSKLKPDQQPKGVGNGHPLRLGDLRPNCVGRDTVMLFLCWDDWEEGAREKVEGVMKRVNE